MKHFLLRFSRLILGLFLFALGIVLTLRANIGYGSWEVFHAGLSKTFGISIGFASIIVGLIILSLLPLLKEAVGIGTILNIILIGWFIDIILALNFIPKADNMFFGTLLILLGLCIIAFGSYFYIGSGFGAGPRDALMVGLTRLTKLPIGLVRTIIELTAICVGWLLGGMVGLGTIISGVSIGFIIQAIFKILKFDPTKIHHTSFSDIYKKIAYKNKAP